MNLIVLFKKIQPYVKPYKWLVVLTLILTLIGSFIAQINAVVLDKTVDAINELIMTHDLAWKNAVHILTIISIVLIGKEILSAIITYAQHYSGEKMRINVSKDLSQAVIDHMLTYRMAFFSRQDNETGKLQTRIDQGVSSLSSTVQNFFIDLLPLFMSAILALILMFAANFLCGTYRPVHRTYLYLDHHPPGTASARLETQHAPLPRAEEPWGDEHHRKHQCHQVVQPRTDRKRKAMAAADGVYRQPDAGAENLLLL